MFSNRINVDINEIDAVINSCLEWGIFDEKIFKKHQILTSTGIQKRYFEIIKRRQKVDIVKEYLLVAYSEYLDTDKIDVNINEIYDDNNSQRKGKERKGKVKEKENKEKIKYVVDYLNKTLGTTYTYKSKKTVECITARLNDDFQGKHFKIVIDKKYKEWGGTKDAKYLRPETLFGNKFEGYLNQLDSPSEKEADNIENRIEELSGD